MNLFTKLFRKLFLRSEIISKTGVLHFQRWRLIETPWFRCYIHYIFESDKDLHLHSHPWDFWSFVLSGGYVEELLGGEMNIVRRFKWNHHAASDYHRLTLTQKPTISLFFATGKRQVWGYFVPEMGGLVDDATYRRLKNE